MVLECKYCKQTTTLDVIPTCCYPKINKKNLQEMGSHRILSIKQENDLYTKKLQIKLSNNEEYSINFIKNDIFIEKNGGNTEKEEYSNHYSILFCIVSFIVNIVLLKIIFK